MRHAIMSQLHRNVSLLSLVWLLIGSAFAIDVDFSNIASVKSAASTIAYDMMSYYQGNQSGQIPGLLPGPYYWWEAGGMWGVMIDYWSFTGDTSYNSVVSQGLQFQVGQHQDFNPSNQSVDMGNDDQAFWAFAALTAAETNFPNPPVGDPSWLSLAQAVFNDQIARWDASTCGGGLHWQVYNIETGYNLKNTIANVGLMQIAARLSRYTNGVYPEYAQWANSIWNWMWSVGLIDHDTYDVYDSVDANNNCTTIGGAQYSYNHAALLIATATMYNITTDPAQAAIWANRTTAILTNLVSIFFNDGVLWEAGCEDHPSSDAKGCDTDQLSFKAYDARWMATTSQLAPFTESTITPLLLTSAQAAAASCIHPGLPLNGNSDGLACAAQWTNGSTWDGTIGVGQQMSALSTILSTIIKTVPAPLTNSTGGTSASNPTAGFNSSSVPPGAYIPPPTSGDRVGAWFITVVMAVLVAGMCAFMWSTAWEDKPDQVTGRGEKGKEDFRMTGAVAGARTNTAVSGGVLSAVPEHEPNHLHRKPIYLGGTVAT